MPYRDSIGQPAGYQNGSPYGALEPEDMYEDDVLNEPVNNPLTDGEMYEAEMGPEMGQNPQAQMNPEEAGQMMRERLRKRQEQLSSMSMRFMDVTHELNK